MIHPLTLNTACCLAALPLLLGLSTASAETPQAWVDQHLEEVVDMYHYLHMHPELSFQEKETAAYLAKQWKELGAEVTTDIGGHGLVGLIKNGEGPTLMLRTDLDALPVTEETELGYASKVKVPGDAGTEVGVMHACGHDIHMANLTGVARYLAANKKLWRGTVMLVGQPAEERGAGAKAMLDDGLFKRFKKPDFALALHVSAEAPAGEIGFRAGYAMANVDSVDIIVRGRGGHGAHPDTTVDPIVQTAQLIFALQTIVSREVKPIEPAVITIGSIHGGTKHNIIGNSVHLQITVRSYSDKVRKQLLDSIAYKARAVATLCKAPEPEVKISEGTPSLSNDEELTARLVTVFKKVVGEKSVVPIEPTMGGEDFSRYGRAGVPSFMYRLGSVEPKRLERFKQLNVPPPSLHSSKYYPEADVSLRAGIITMSTAALDLLKP